MWASTILAVLESDFGWKVENPSIFTTHLEHDLSFEMIPSLDPDQVVVKLMEGKVKGVKGTQIVLTLEIPLGDFAGLVAVAVDCFREARTHYLSTGTVVVKYPAGFRLKAEPVTDGLNKGFRWTLYGPANEQRTVITNHQQSRREALAQGHRAYLWHRLRGPVDRKFP